MKQRVLGNALSVIALALALLALLPSCSRPLPEPKLGLTPVLAGGIGWALVDIAYARLKTAPSFQASDGGYARLGDVLEIRARSRLYDGPDRGLWYAVLTDAGTVWLHESWVTVHATEGRARKAAEAGL